MPNYEMTAREFCAKSGTGEMDYLGFSKVFTEKIEKISRKFKLLRESGNILHSVVLDRPLFGLPVVVSDGICVKGFKATAGSQVLKNYEPDYDATLAGKLRETSAAFAGKANQDELGICGLGAKCSYGNPKNPADESMAAGCCGGTAGIIAATKMPIISIGHAACGGICSAAWTKTYALMPKISIEQRHGLIEGAGSIERLSLFTGSCEDMEFAYRTILNGTKSHDINIKGMRIAVLQMEFQTKNEKEDEKVFWQHIQALESKGAVISRIKPDFSAAAGAWMNIINTEAAFNMKRYSGMKFGGSGVPKISLKQPSQVAYRKSLAYKEELRKKFQKIFSNYDVMVAPAMAQGTMKASEASRQSLKNIANLHSPSLPMLMADLPMAVVPAGKCGISIAGMDEASVLEAVKSLI